MFINQDKINISQMLTGNSSNSNKLWFGKVKYTFSFNWVYLFARCCECFYWIICNYTDAQKN